MPRKLSTSVKATSRYNNDCSVAGFTKNFMKIRKDAAVPKPVSTGSMVGDWVVTKTPVIGKGIKFLNRSNQAGAYVAHGINAYKESCGNRKRK